MQMWRFYQLPTPFSGPYSFLSGFCIPNMLQVVYQVMHEPWWTVWQSSYNVTSFQWEKWVSLMRQLICIVLINKDMTRINKKLWRHQIELVNVTKSQYYTCPKTTSLNRLSIFVWCRGNFHYHVRQKWAIYFSYVWSEMPNTLLYKKLTFSLSLSQNQTKQLVNHVCRTMRVE